MPWPTNEQITQNLRSFLKHIIFPLDFMTTLDLQITSFYRWKRTKEHQSNWKWEAKPNEKANQLGSGHFRKGALKQGCFCPYSCPAPFPHPTSTSARCKNILGAEIQVPRVLIKLPRPGPQRYSISLASRWCYFPTFMMSQWQATGQRSLCRFCFPSSFMLLGCLKMIKD